MKKIKCPFIITCDSREKSPYLFQGLQSNADTGHAIIEVETMRIALPNGDYSIFGYPQVCVERKSVADLYASVARRANFESRLERMSELTYAAVVVEAERMACIARPPAFSKYNPRALSRTLIAWDVRYPVKWHFMPGREAAEALTYRILEAFHKQHRDEVAQP